MFPRDEPARLAIGAAAVASCLLCTGPSAAIPADDAISSYVKTLEGSPPPSVLVADPPPVTSGTISLDQWEIPMQQMEWDTRPLPPRRASWDAYYRRVSSRKPTVTNFEKLQNHVYRLYRRTTRALEYAVGDFF